MFRDHVRSFLKGSDSEAGPFATALCGSQSLYGPSKTPVSSVNFITAHDGFSLKDLVSYQEKQNLENGENNRDGTNQNNSWNCGHEGTTKDPLVNALREKQMRNFLLALFLSQGIPMLVMGDEIGHTRKGNNNPYVQDNEINWFNWDEIKQNQAMLSFVSGLIAFRKSHATLKHNRFLTSADIDWHGHQPFHPDWSASSRFVACTLKDKQPLYIAFNADFRPASIQLPPNMQWHLVVDTSKNWDQHNFAQREKSAPLQSHFEMAPYSALIAKASS